MIPRNVQKIGHFVAVAKARSLSEAARQLGISQPALTASIRKLEAALGFELFDREHGFHLSALGSELLVRAEAAFLHVRDLEREVEGMRSGTLGEIRAACGPTVADGIVGMAIGSLLKSRPGLKVRMHVGPFIEMPKLLRDRKIDFFIADHSLLGGDVDLEILPLSPQEIVFFCRAGHPLAGRKKVGLEEFFSYPHVGPALPAMAEEWLSKHRPENAPSKGLHVECSHHALLKAVVESSDAISGAPRQMVQADLELGRFARVKLAAEPLQHRAGVVWLRGRQPTPAGRMLIAELQRLADAWAAGDSKA